MALNKHFCILYFLVFVHICPSSPVRVKLGKLTFQQAVLLNKPNITLLHYLFNKCKLWTLKPDVLAVKASKLEFITGYAVIHQVVTVR